MKMRMRRITRLDETSIQPLAAEADDESEDFGGKAGGRTPGLGRASVKVEKGFSKKKVEKWENR